jgi:hypothetical protein
MANMKLFDASFRVWCRDRRQTQCEFFVENWCLVLVQARCSFSIVSLLAILYLAIQSDLRIRMCISPNVIRTIEVFARKSS